MDRTAVYYSIYSNTWFLIFSENKGLSDIGIFRWLKLSKLFIFRIVYILSDIRNIHIKALSKIMSWLMHHPFLSLFLLCYLCSESAYFLGMAKWHSSCQWDISKICWEFWGNFANIIQKDICLPPYLGVQTWLLKFRQSSCNHEEKARLGNHKDIDPAIIKLLKQL